MKKLLIAGLFIAASAAVSAVSFTPTPSYARDASAYGGEGRAGMSQQRFSRRSAMRNRMMMRQRMMMKRRMMRDRM